MALKTVIVTETFIEQEDVNLRRGLERFKRLNDVGVRAGIIEGLSEDYPDGMSVVEVATYNHEGTEHIPSRPWLTLAFDRNLPFMQAQMEAAANNILLGRTTIGRAMAQVGQQLSGMQRQSLQQLDTPPLSPRTIEAKRAARKAGRKKSSGFPADNPLIETGHLLEQHVFVVEGAGVVKNK